MPRRALSAALLVGAALALLPAAASAQAESPPAPVDVIEVSGLLDPVLADFVTEQLAAAPERGAQALVLQLNSRGSVLDVAALTALAFRIDHAAIPVGIWVGPSGAQATGATAQLLAVADVVALAPGTEVGDLGRPVPGVVLEPAAAERLADEVVGPEEARQLGVADLDAPVLGDFVVGLDGREVDGTTLRTATIVQREDGPRREPVAQVRFSQLPLLDQLFHTVASAPVAYLLLLAGLTLVVFEAFTGGLGVAAAVACGCLALAAYGLDVLPARGWAVALVLLAFVAFAIDVQAGLPRFWTAVGAVLLLVGSLAMFEDHGLSWLPLVAGLGLVGAMVAVGIPTTVRTRFATSSIDRGWLVGERGVVEPGGRVRVREVVWPVAGAVPADGALVEVTAVDGPRVVVAAADR